MKELKFKVRFGYSIMDRVSIGVNELEKALYAQKFGVPVLLNGKQISGKEIKVIEPDYNHYTGWFDSYQPNSPEDLVQIERDCPKGIEGTIKQYRERIDYLLATGKKQLIGKNVSIPELEKPNDLALELPNNIKQLYNAVSGKINIRTLDK